jgi:ORF6N domain
MTGLVAARAIDRLIHEIRGERVMLDSDLASLYGVQTKSLNRAVKRNLDRFPVDFMFQLTVQELQALRFQSGTSNSRSPSGNSKTRGGRRYRPYAFSEQGVAMLSSVLRSRRAVKVNVEIMRTFVRLRRMAITHTDLARRLDELESKYDAQFKVVFDAIRQLMQPPERPRPQIGFGG